MFARKRIWWITLSMLVATGLLLGFGGCGGDDDDDDDATAERTPLELTRAGWGEFEALDFDAALELFNQAIDAGVETADAYSGAGWTYYLVGEDVAQARSVWNDGLQFDVGAVNDIRAGLGALEYDEGNYSEAIAWFEMVVTNSPSFRFIHMPSFTIEDIYLGLSDCYYLNDDFTTALGYVQELNPIFSADVSTAEGVAALAAEIERLAGIVGG